MDFTYNDCAEYLSMSWHLPECLVAKCSLSKTRDLRKFITSLEIQSLHLTGRPIKKIGRPAYSPHIQNLHLALRQSSVAQLFSQSPIHPTTFDSRRLYSELKQITSADIGHFINMIKQISYLVKLQPQQVRDQYNSQLRTRLYTSVRNYTRDDFFTLLSGEFSEEEKTYIYTAVLERSL